jgi:outer membrane lipoprotein-sorting protein
MKKFLYIVLTMLIFLSVNVKGSEKEKIIENLKKINSIKFNFTQITNDIIENGNCIIVYSKKMRCLYEEEDKEIIVNDDDYLLLINKRENKNYNYNIKDTPLGVMLDKENIIEKLSKVEKFNKIGKNIIAIIDINSQESIEIYFNSKEMNITGWKIKNYDKSSLEFLMNNISININTNEKFEIPK